MIVHSSSYGVEWIFYTIILRYPIVRHRKKSVFYVFFESVKCKFSGKRKKISRSPHFC